jgi:hypothetical protein
MRSHQICLGDVVRVLERDDLTAQAQERVVNLLGFTLQGTRETSLPEPVEAEAGTPSAQQPEPEPQAPAQAPPIDDQANEAWIDELIRPARAEAPVWFQDAKSLGADHEPDDLPQQRVETLFPPEGERAMLISILSTPTRVFEVDLPQLVERMANLEVLTKLPPLRRLSTTGGVQVLLDTSKRMQPFAQDQSQLVDALRRLLPDQRLRVLHCDGAPPDDAQQARHARAYRYPPNGTLVILVSDLGQGGGIFAPHLQRPRRWIDFARRLSEHGCAFLVLAPVSPDRIDARLSRRLEIIPWDRRFSAAVLRARQRPQGRG